MNPEVSKKLDQFFSKYREINFKNKEILINSSEKPSGVFYLTEGIVRQCALTVSGNELNINTFKPNSLFPMAWVLNDTISSHYFQAHGDVTVWIAPKKDFSVFLKEEPEILLDLIKRIYRGMEGYFMKMEHLMSGSAYSKIVVAIIIYGKRFGSEQNGKITFRLSEADLAAEYGMARETISREIQNLKRKNLIKFEKNIITILDPIGLEKELM